MLGSDAHGVGPQLASSIGGSVPARSESTRRFVTFAAMSVLIVSLAGCSQSKEAPSDVTSAEFADLMNQIISDARAGGASEAQVALLESAATSGELTIEQARESARSYMACLDTVGLNSDYVESTSTGVVIPSVHVYAFTLEEMETMQQCDTKENFWVNYVYQTQPSSIELQDAYLEQQRPALVACLEAAGIEVPDDEDVRVTLNRAASEMEAGGVDCIEGLGISGW